MQNISRNSLIWLALAVSFVPFLSTLSMLGLQAGIGPRFLFYIFAQVTGVFLMFLIVIGSALAVVALGRSNERHDIRIYATFLFCLLSILGLIFFSQRV